MKGNRDSGIREILPVESESWALESGIQLKESGIPLKIGIQDPLTETGIQNPRLSRTVP